MHIIIAIITAIAGLIWALNSLQRAGFDLNSLNPWYWARRKRWEQKQINPLYAIESPRELASLLTFAAMKQTGDPTAEQKDHLLALYKDTLQYSEGEASEMYSLASHLLNTDPNYLRKVSAIVAPSLEAMSEDQKGSILESVRAVIRFSGSQTALQTEFVSEVEKALR